MLEALWSTFLHPSMIAGKDGAGTLVSIVVAVALITVAFMAAVGRRIMHYSSVIAFLLGSAFLPLLMNALALAISLNETSGGDGGGILVGITFVLSVWVLPITTATSVLYIVIRRGRLRVG